LLRSGISYTEFAEVSRIAFVEISRKDFGIRGRPTNISRISAMTGIPRKEVRRLRKLSDDLPENPRVEFSPLSDVLHRWFTDERYLDSSGHPRKLRIAAGHPSFAELVKECAGDVPVGAFRVELIRCGAVVEDSNGRLVPKRRYVVRERANEKAISALVFGLRGLASTAAFNIDNADESGRIERFVESDPMTDQDIATVRSTLRKRIAHFTEEIDDFFSKSRRDTGSCTRRVGVGVYYYEDD
jgi:hypothetical protein